MPPARRFSKSLKKRTYKKAPSFEKRVKAIVLRTAETKSKITVKTELVEGTTNSPYYTYRLNDLLQGDSAHQREGAKVTGSLMDIRGSIYCAHNKPVVHKIMVIECNKQSDPLVDLLENDNGVFAPGSGDLKDIYARVNTTKYKVLATRKFITGNSTNASIHATTQVAKLFNLSFKTRGTYEYDHTAAQPQKRVIRFLIISRRLDNDSGALTLEHTFNSKWYFKDL